MEALAFPVYSTEIGRMILTSLKGKGSPSARVRHMLLAANRWEMEPTLRGWLAEGRTVVLDRFSASNYAYGLANGLPLRWLENLEKGLPEPDLTVIIDILPETSLTRKPKGRDSYERDLEFLSRVRASYLQLAKNRHWPVVNGERVSDEIREEILKIMDRRLGGRHQP